MAWQGIEAPKQTIECSPAPSFFSSKKWVPKTIGNRKRDCAWGCARGKNTTWENLQIEKHKSGRRSFRSPDWFFPHIFGRMHAPVHRRTCIQHIRTHTRSHAPSIPQQSFCCFFYLKYISVLKLKKKKKNWFLLFDLKIFSGGVYPPSATSRTISFFYVDQKEMLPPIIDGPLWENCLGIERKGRPIEWTFINQNTSLAPNACVFGPSPLNVTSDLGNICPSDVQRVLRSLPNKTSCGSDQISYRMMEAGQGLVGPLVSLFNASLRLRQVPDEWRKAIIKPIFKGGKKDRRDPCQL